MDTTASSRPDFRDPQNHDSAIPFHQHSLPAHSTPQHYSSTAPFSQPLAPSSSTLQPYLPSSRQHTLPQPFPQHQPSVLNSATLPQPHDPPRQPPPPLPSTSAPLSATPFTPSDSLLRQPPLPHASSLPNASQPQQFSHQPPFKPLPSHPDSIFQDAQQKSVQPADTSKRLQLPPSPSHHTRHPPPLIRPQGNQQSQLHDHRKYPRQSTVPAFPTPSPPLASLDKKPEPFPYTKSLPFPLGTHSSHPASNPTTAPQPAPAVSAPALTDRTASTQQPPISTSPSRANNAAPQQEQGPLYDISKLLAAHCTILSGKVYNDKGHNICGVLNQHDKPCKRIGKCPFHGIHKPVTSENSVNGNIDASGTVSTPSTSPDGTHSPPGQSAGLYDRSPGGSDSTAVNGSKPKIPPKQQYKHGWSKEEHFLFLGGLSQHGKGSWKQIASVVKTRTPTQVQSHAQKYFQRQKQADKNKRSIHDLSLDSPEMIEVAKKFKTNSHRIGVAGSAIAPPMPISGMGDGIAFRGHGAAMTASALTLGNSGLHADNIGRGVLNDGGFPRFGNNLNNTMVAKFGPGQATSTTTLGSTLSSGVQIPQIPGAPVARHFPAPNANLGQQDLFRQFNQNALTSGQPRRGVDGRLSLKMDGTPGRDVILNSVRPAFIPDTYQGSADPQMVPGQHFLGSKQTMYNSPPKQTLGHHGNDPSTQPDQGATHAHYANGLQSLYPQMAGNATVFQQSRGHGDGQFHWNYESESKAKRPRDPSAMNRDAYPMHNPSTLTALHGIGQMSVPTDHVGGAAGVGNEPQVEHPFMSAPSAQGNAFTNGIFGSNEGVEVDTNVYGVGVGVGNAQSNQVVMPGRLGANVGGYPPTTVGLGQMPLQTAFDGGAGSYRRND